MCNILNYIDLSEYQKDNAGPNLTSKIRNVNKYIVNFAIKNPMQLIVCV